MAQSGVYAPRVPAKPPSPIAARRTLREALADETAGVHPLGHAWLRARVLPAIAALERGERTSADTTLLAAAWTLVGEVHELVDAPRAAAAAYTRALRHAPADRELRALRSEARVAASRMRRDAVSESAELLASGRSKRALAELTALRSARGLMARARAHGALGDAARVIATYEALAKTRGALRLELADWFYLPDAVFEAPAFWRALARLVPRLAQGSVFVHANGARDAFDPSRAPFAVGTARATWRRVIAAQLRRVERR